jgi:hypothetical protein
MFRSHYAPRRGNFPEPRLLEVRARARAPVVPVLLPLARVVLGIALAAPACSGSARAVRLPVPAGSPEVFRISCDKRISACRDKAEEVCAGSYDVLETTGASIEPERVSSAPGPRSTGPRYQQAKWLGQMVITCGEPRVADAAAEQSPTKSAEPASSAQPAPLLANEQACVPGVTQACLGPGACRGAQACLVDGRGYGACDCGSSPGKAEQRADPESLSGDAGAAQ